MAYLKNVPEDCAKFADWALHLKNGTHLPVHSQLLCTLSPVLNGLASTKPASHSRFAIEVPFDRSEQAARLFLSWVYHCKIVWSVLAAKELAEIASFWDVQGTALLGAAM